MILTVDTVSTGADLLRPGWIDVSGGLIRAIGSGVPPLPADLRLGAMTVVPGFVDTHLHGGGGCQLLHRRQYRDRHRRGVAP